MGNTSYVWTIEVGYGGDWEPMPEADFDSEQEAEEGMRALIEVWGWGEMDLRVVERIKCLGFQAAINQTKAIAMQMTNASRYVLMAHRLLDFQEEVDEKFPTAIVDSPAHLALQILRMVSSGSFDKKDQADAFWLLSMHETSDLRREESLVNAAALGHKLALNQIILADDSQLRAAYVNLRIKQDYLKK